MEINTLSFDKKFFLLQNYLKGCHNQKPSLESHSCIFSRLTENCQKVKFAFEVLVESQLLTLVRENVKSDERSVGYREKGNKKYLQKQDLSAIQYYSVSAAFASFASEELSVTFANRSAVTFSLGEYSTSLNDIERALNGKYPQQLRYKLYERKGKCLKVLGDTTSSKEAFQMALEFLSHSDLDENKIESTTSAIKKMINDCSRAGKPAESELKCLPCIQEKNTVILSASALVKIEHSDDLGRHLVATENIEPGEVLVVEEPFSSVLLPNMYNTHCFHCIKRCHSLIPCLHCVNVMYCSESCRSASYEENHRIECKLIPQLIALEFTKIELIAVRTLLVATKKYKSLKEFIKLAPKIKSYEDPKTNGLDESGHYNSGDYRTVHHLVGNGEFRFNADVFRRATAAAYIVWLLEKCTDYFSSQPPEDKTVDECTREDKYVVGGLLLKFLMIVASNAHEVSEMMVTGAEAQCESVEVGGALYPVLSLINHSCDPNVVRHSYNGALNVLTTIQVIRAGEQICDNYGYHHAMHDLSTRYSKLRDQYLFTCECVACREDWPVYDKLPETNPIYLIVSLKEEVEKSSEIFEEVLTEIKSGKTEGKLGFLYAHLALLHRAVKRPWKEYSACQEAIKQCLSRQANHYITR